MISSISLLPRRENDEGDEVKNIIEIRNKLLEKIENSPLIFFNEYAFCFETIQRPVHHAPGHSLFRTILPA
jgi:hypothetical protein